ncbi:SAM-dependent DNA methyltransferase [Nocardioides sp. CBS4Y-1]|uniref:site-specific DNA-methyltransferase (adenine-specific) n=1 Tax=Nocardioides acrostichi TaxID=2784339 RepID=A0A930UYS3_9ACTN|nr:SAM-dependent DNA methyltransferase [Nocardioides acrostichi]
MKNHSAFIWSVADLLRGDFKQSEYGRVVLPFVVLRRLDCVLEPTKAKVLAVADKLAGKVDNIDPLLRQAAGDEQFYNTSPLTITRLLDDPTNLADNLHTYLRAFSPGAADVLEKFDLHTQVDRLDRAGLLYLVVSKFAEIDLHPETVSNLEMGYLYEELVRRFSELSNETAGEHFTPREVIRLMVNLLFIEDDDLLTKPGIVKTLADVACGTGGMLSVAQETLRHLNPQARLEVYGQELNAETYAICRSDMMLKGQDASHIVHGNSFSEDGLDGPYDYLIANPPFGVEWKKVEQAVRDEHESKGFAGRFGAGLPRINDGSFLFLQHMISKMKTPEQGGSRVAIVFNGSPLFTGAAGSGESEIRRWIIENDWLEAVVALPDQLFYNTGISTYFWIVTNRKAPERRGMIQLVDARDRFQKMRKSLGEKRKQLADDHITEITKLYGDFTDSDRVKILPNESFGFLRVTVERPLRLRWEITDGTLAAIRADKKLAKLQPDVLDTFIERLSENVGLTETDRKIIANTVDPILKTAGLATAQAKAVWANLAIQDPDAPAINNRKGDPEPDPDLRDQENVAVPTGTITRYEADATGRLASAEYVETVENHLITEVHPYVPDAWIDHTKTKIGHEIPLTRHFYKHAPSRTLVEIDAEITTLETEIQALLREVTDDVE